MTMQVNPFQSQGSKKKDSSKTVEHPSNKKTASHTTSTQPPQAATTITTTKVLQEACNPQRSDQCPRNFLKAISLGLGTKETYSNPETIPPLEAAYKNFKHVYSRFSKTAAVERLREREYSHLGEGEHCVIVAPTI